MSVDMFGCQLVNSKGSKSPPGIGFTLIKIRNYSLENKKLCNLKVASEDTDTVNLKVLKEKFEVFDQDIAKNDRKIRCFLPVFGTRNFKLISMPNYCL